MSEVKKILSEHGLLLGMIVPEFDILRFKYEQSQNIDSVKEHFKRTRKWVDYKTTVIVNGKHFIRKSDDGFEIESDKYENGLVI